MTTTQRVIPTETFDQFEAILKCFLASDDFKAALLAHCCHTNQWHYNHQTLKVRLYLNGTWVCPSEYSWVRSKNECIVTLSQIGSHFSRLAEIGDTRKSFEDILLADPQEAREVARCLYLHQEAYLKERALHTFAYLRDCGRLD
jgi:hypothetical protein